MKKILMCVICLILAVLFVINSNKAIEVQAFYNDDLFSGFTSDSYVLLDVESGSVLASKNSDQKMPVASICKLMTSLIVMEKVDNGIVGLNDFVVASDYACSMEGSQAFLDSGSKYTVSDLLKSVIVASANDSAVALAEHVCGSENLFVSEMNKRAKELGMDDTIYANATGLPAPNQHSTAFDTSIILKEVSKQELYLKFSNVWMDKLVHPSGRETELVNTNRLIKYYDKCKTGKTGFTDEAGYCLASMSDNNNLKLIAVTLKCDKAQDRFKESVELFNYGFANYQNKKIIDSSVQLDQNIVVVGGTEIVAPVKFKNDFSVVVNKSDRSKCDVKIDLKKSIFAPASKNDVVGKATIVKEGKVLGEVDILIAEDIKKQNIKDIFNKISNNWLIFK